MSAGKQERGNKDVGVEDCPQRNATSAVFEDDSLHVLFREDAGVPGNTGSITLEPVELPLLLALLVDREHFTHQRAAGFLLHAGDL